MCAGFTLVDITDATYGFIRARDVRDADVIFSSRSETGSLFFCNDYIAAGCIIAHSYLSLQYCCYDFLDFPSNIPDSIKYSMVHNALVFSVRQGEVILPSSDALLSGQQDLEKILYFDPIRYYQPSLRIKMFGDFDA